MECDTSTSIYENASASNGWKFVNFEEAVEIYDNLRKPVNSSDRQKRISGKEPSSLYPYYGATGQVGYIDDYLSDGEYVLLGEDGAPFLDPASQKAYVIEGKAWVNNHAHVLKSKYDNHFLCYYLNQFNYNGYVVGTTRYKLTQKRMKDILIPVPSLTEQQAIVRKIESLFASLDKGVACLIEAKNKIETYRLVILQSAYSGEFTQSKPCTITKLGELIDKPRYGTSKKCVSEKSENCSAVYRIPNIDIISGKVSHDDLKYAVFEKDEIDSLKIDVGDILMIRSNGSLSLVGRAALVSENDTDGLFAGYLMRLHIKNKSEILPKYVLYYLNSHVAREYIEDVAKSTSGVNNINSHEVMNIPIPLFEFEEQSRIVSEIETRFAACDAAEKQIDASLAKAELLRQSILKKAFAGELI